MPRSDTMPRLSSQRGYLLLQVSQIPLNGDPNDPGVNIGIPVGRHIPHAVCGGLVLATPARPRKPVTVER